MNSTLPGSSAAAPQPPFAPVQVMDCLPPAPSIPAPSVQSSETKSHATLKPTPLRRDNPTGLTRAEIRLLAEAVKVVQTYGVNYLQAFSAFEAEANLKKLAQAIRKLKVASGYTFTGKSGRRK